MSLSANHVAWLVWITTAVIIIALFPMGRSLLGFIVGQAWKLILHVGNILLAGAQASIAHVWRAHMIIARNLAPRGAVLPTVANKTVRRD